MMANFVCRSTFIRCLFYSNSHIMVRLNSGIKKNVRRFSNEVRAKVSSGMPLSKYLQAMINFKGPISVSDYMKEALTNPIHGYYMKKDVFGTEGDFITSPEINQLFGEMIAIWSINEWKKIGSPKPLFLIELGPGRGTMMADILRVYKMFNLLDELSCHLVELSPELSRIQSERLNVSLEECDDSSSQFYKRGLTDNGVPVSWYNHFKCIPPGFSIIIAHEFFDALPIHKFKKTEKGWREILIDVDPKDIEGNKFRYVLAPGPSLASKAFIKENEARDELEVSPQSGIIMNEMATRLEQYGGFALIADYGHDGTSSDTFRAFKDHQQTDPLVNPGMADLTVDVDFNYLKENTLNKLISFGPVKQQEFLIRLHIDLRLQILLKTCKTHEERESLISGYKVMMDPDKMGNRFKFISFFPAVLKAYLSQMPVAGFSDV